jgi:ABC-2 type transport system ATP-binding protein
VLDTTMEEMGARFAEVLVNADQLEAARALNPIDERAAVFGKSICVYDGADPERLAQLGEVKRPSVSDLFVATMKGTYA